MSGSLKRNMIKQDPDVREVSITFKKQNKEMLIVNELLALSSLVKH